MSRIYRGIFIALAGLILCAANPPQPNGEKPDTSSASKVEQSLADIASSLREVNKPSDLDQPCEQGEDQRASDLCAQWKAADAASSAASATWLFGALGTLIGGLTLGAAAAAAYFARKAAVETEKGANAALEAVKETREANKIAERNAQRGMRPYLWPEAAWFDIDENEAITAHVHIKNYGQTPAINSRGWIHTWIAPYPLEDALPEPGAGEVEMASVVIGSGQHSEFRHPRMQQITPHSLQAIRDETAALYVYGHGTYLDTFGKGHFFRYIYLANGNGFDRRRFRPYSSGNIIDIE